VRRELNRRLGEEDVSCASIGCGGERKKKKGRVLLSLAPLYSEEGEIEVARSFTPPRKGKKRFALIL